MRLSLGHSGAAQRGCRNASPLRPELRARRLSLASAARNSALILLNDDAAHRIGINDTNQIISVRGVQSNGVTVHRGCLWQMKSAGQWQMTDLPPLAGDNAAEAHAINKNGLVVGTSYTTTVDAT